jgi:transposase InsO family protein
MKNGRFSDAQVMAILKQAEGGVPVSELCREPWDEQREFLQVAGQMWRHGRIFDCRDEGHGRAEPPPEEDVCGDEHATQWLWTYNNARPNMGIGGVTPAMKLKTAA